MTVFTVTAAALNRSTRQPVGEPRDEVIDTETNEIFTRASTALDVERIYESFWNDINPESDEIVKVIGVVSS